MKFPFTIITLLFFYSGSSQIYDKSIDLTSNSWESSFVFDPLFLYFMQPALGDTIVFYDKDSINTEIYNRRQDSAFALDVEFNLKILPNGDFLSYKLKPSLKDGKWKKIGEFLFIDGVITIHIDNKGINGVIVMSCLSAANHKITWVVNRVQLEGIKVED